MPHRLFPRFVGVLVGLPLGDPGVSLLVTVDAPFVGTRRQRSLRVDDGVDAVLRNSSAVKTKRLGDCLRPASLVADTVRRLLVESVV